MSFVIKSVRKDPENVYDCTDNLLIESEDGRIFRLDLNGDCCSSSYFESQGVKEAQELVGETLVGVDQATSAIPDNDNDGGDATRYHAVVLRTNQSTITLDWRNESNGYYDGWCSITLPDEGL